MSEGGAYPAIGSFLRPAAFYGPNCGIIYAAIESMIERGQKVDLLTVSEAVKSEGITASYLVECTEATTTTAAIEYHAEIVHQKAKAREALALAVQLEKAAYADEHLDAALVMGSERLADMQASGRVQFETSETVITAGLNSTLHAYEMQRQHRGWIPGYRTGFPGLDRMILGLTPGKHHIFAGRPGAGKSSLLLDLVDGLERHGTPSLVISLEDDSEGIAARMLSRRSRVAGMSLRTGSYGAVQVGDISTAAQSMARYRAQWDFKSFKLSQVRRAIRQAAQKGVQVVFLDYLQLVEHDGQKQKWGSYESATDISKKLTQDAKASGIALVSMAQLSRAGDSRSDKRPIMSDLRDSGQIEQDAYVIGFIHRPIMYNDDAPPDDARLIIRKARNGLCGELPLRFIGSETRFEEPNAPLEPIPEAQDEIAWTE